MAQIHAWSTQHPIKRVKNWPQLQEENDAKLNRFAQLTFALHVKTTATSIPDPRLKWIPGSLYWMDAVKIYLHRQLYHESARHYEVTFGVSKTTMTRLIKWVVHQVIVLL